MSDTFDPMEGVDKKDPLDLPNERPDYVEDKTGNAGDERVKPDVNAGPEDVGFLGEGKRPTVHLDKEKVRKHDEEIARDPSKGA